MSRRVFNIDLTAVVPDGDERTPEVVADEILAALDAHVALVGLEVSAPLAEEVCPECGRTGYCEDHGWGLD
jgi:hypothetical protein